LFPGTPMSSTDKSDHGIAETLLKVALDTITLTLTPKIVCFKDINWSLCDTVNNLFFSSKHVPVLSV